MQWTSQRAAAAGLAALALGGCSQGGVASQPGGGRGPPEAAAPPGGAAALLARAPLAFVPNRGQADPRVRYEARAAGARLSFTRRHALLAFSGSRGRGYALALRFRGARRDVRIAPGPRVRTRFNFLRGRDPRDRQRGVQGHRGLTYRSLWPGVHLRFRGGGGSLKYEFELAPGVRAGTVRLAYAGASRLSVDGAGNLAVETPRGTLRDARPFTFQRIRGRRVPVASRFVLHGGNRYGFAVGPHDRTRPLTIDPGLAYATFLGGADMEALGIAVDPAGAAYVAGGTAGGVIPATAGAYDTTANGDQDAFVAKVAADGSHLVYATYLGGSAIDGATGIAVDATGSAFVTGLTVSADFPTTLGAWDRFRNANGDAFVAKLAPDGSALVWSTFFGSDWFERPTAIGIDDAGAAYITGRTGGAAVGTPYPMAAGGAPPDSTYGGGNSDGYVAKIGAGGATLSYATLLGGAGIDFPLGIAVGSGAAYVTGNTSSADFPTTPGAFQTTRPGQQDAFVTKVGAAGTSFAYSTYLGGSNYEDGRAIAVDAAGRAVVTGSVFESADFPTTPGAYDTTANGGEDAFVTQLEPDGSAPSWSTYLGSTEDDTGHAIALSGGRPVVAGQTDGDFPTSLDGYDRTANGGMDAFASKLTADGAGLTYSTLLGSSSPDYLDSSGGVAVDDGGDVYVTGRTSPGEDVSNFPTTAGAFDTTQNGFNDAFVAKLDLPADAGPRPDTAITSEPPSPGNDSTPTFAFESDDEDALFECRFDGSASYTGCSSPFTPTARTEGTHTFEVRARNLAGDEDQSPASSVFTIDLTPPDTTTAGPLGGTPTSDTTPTFTLESDEPGSTFECRIDTPGSYGACPSPFTAASLGDGPHTLHARAIDPAGNVDPEPAERQFRVDTIAPHTTFRTGPDGPTADSTPTFEFHPSEEGVGLECRVDDDAFAPCTAPFTTRVLSDGPHAFDVRGTDAAGNAEPEAQRRSFTVDTTAPETTITDGPDGLTDLRYPTWSFTSDDPAARYRCRIDGQSRPCESTLRVAEGLTLGVHAFDVTAVDALGNADATPAVRVVEVVTATPVDTMILAGPTNVTIALEASFDFAASVEGSSFECRLDLGAWEACPATHTVTSLALGPHLLDVRAVTPVGDPDLSPARAAFTVIRPAGCTDTTGNGSVDDDGDALCDNWETSGVDADADGSADLVLYDDDGDGRVEAGERADPRHKDVYVELDYGPLHRPDAGAVADVVAAFARAPVTNPDGEPGVTLHVRVDEQVLDTDDAVYFTTFPGLTPNFFTVKAERFATAAERGAGAPKVLAKRFAFHYGVFAHRIDNLFAIGRGERPGNDFAVGLGAASASSHTAGTRGEQADTFMHELGHNLGLHHGGVDAVNCKPNYLSLMSYSRHSGAGLPLDYSRSRLPTLDERSLDETTGVGGGPDGRTVYGPAPQLQAPADSALDFNRDGDVADRGVAADLNSGSPLCDGSGTTLRGYDDWAHLEFQFARTIAFADGARAEVPVEPTAEQLRAVVPPRVVKGRGGIRRASDVVTLPPTRRCVRRGALRVRLRGRTGVTAVELLVNGRRRVRATSRRLGRAVVLRGLPRGRFTVEARVKLRSGRTLVQRRRYRGCRP